MQKDSTYIKYKTGSGELIARIVEDNRGWAISIAKSVARAWNLDWQIDGLDGGAYEALLFCAKRFDPTLGVPFRAYARRRIHEACTAEARKSKDWQHETAHNRDNSGAQQEEREVSQKLFDIYPELREGMVVQTEEGNGGDDASMRHAVRMLLASASLLSLVHDAEEASNPDKALEASQVISILADLSSVHQNLLWDLYWHDYSLRALAQRWGVDELVIIREHQTLVEYLSKRFKNPNQRKAELKVRPTLRPFAEKFKQDDREFPFRDKL